MGCDIHVSVELKVGGRWLHYSRPSVRRNYHLFTAMAGVRASGPVDPIAEPRGLPKDVTESTMIDVDKYGSDGHSHSWLSASEMSTIFDQWQNLGFKDVWDARNEFGFVCGDHLDTCVRYPEEKRPFEDARVVFFFDN